VIRPAAIYGLGEERRFPRIISFAKLGLLPSKVGNVNVKTDWFYVDNLACTNIGRLGTFE
jgi:nucleoside-diphosphate-sugar epimerase